MKNCNKYLKNVYLGVFSMLPSLIFGLLFKNGYIAYKYQILGFLLIIISTIVLFTLIMPYIRCLQRNIDKFKN